MLGCGSSCLLAVAVLSFGFGLQVFWPARPVHLVLNHALLSFIGACPSRALMSLCVCVFVCVCVVLGGVAILEEAKGQLKSWTLCDRLSEGVMGQGLAVPPPPAPRPPLCVCVCVCVCDAQFFQIMLKLRGSTMMPPNHEVFCSVALSPGLRNWIEMTCNMQQEGVGLVLLPRPASLVRAPVLPCAEAPLGESAALLADAGTKNPRVPLELMCWEGVKGAGVATGPA